jgi:acetyl-CoA acetyltransferase
MAKAMAVNVRPAREVVVGGAGLHPFGRFPDKSVHDLAREAVIQALADSGIKFKDIQVAYFGHVYRDGATPGEMTLRQMGLTGIPVVNVENACSSGSTALWLAYWNVAMGMFDIALAFGSEKVPRGPVAATEEGSPARLLGADFMMASYALGMRRYMELYGAPAEAFGQVAVKAHRNAAINPYAHYKKVFTLEEVMNSRKIADPLTLYQCCPTSEGGAAAVIIAKELAAKYVKNPDRCVTIIGASLRTQKWGDEEEDEGGQIGLVGRDAYEMAGVSPKDINVVQVHDAATSGEVSAIEALGLVPKGKAWKMELDGETEIGGSLPVNTDGGLQGMGHPFGATGIRMVHELCTQLRGEAGVRQVKNAHVGLAQNSGAGGVATAFILRK